MAYCTQQTTINKLNRTYMDEIHELYEHCTTENTIMCNKCKTIGREMDCDPYDAATIWSEKGWRITKHQTIYCPKCAKGKLKPKK